MKKMNIKELRTRTGMSQRQFADYFNIPKNTLQNWEQEQRKCPEYLLELIEYKLKNEGMLTVDKTTTKTRELTTEEKIEMDLLAHDIKDEKKKAEFIEYYKKIKTQK